MDRSAINRALAKAMAHRAAGNDLLADQWAAHLVYLLDAARIIDPLMAQHFKVGADAPAR